MAIRSDVGPWFDDYKHIRLTCTVCEIVQHTFVMLSVIDEIEDFKMKHVLCSTDEVDIMTGEPCQ